MQTTTITRSFFSDGPQIVERSRGSAHPKVPTVRPPHVVRPQLALAGRRP